MPTEPHEPGESRSSWYRDQRLARAVGASGLPTRERALLLTIHFANRLRESFELQALARASGLTYTEVARLLPRLRALGWVRGVKRLRVTPPGLALPPDPRLP